MTTDDRALIEAMRDGDEFAFVSLYNRYKDQVYGFCLKMLLNEERAADVMQDTFLRVYENRERLLHAGSFRSWLFTIARNQCLNVIRREKRQVSLEPKMREEASRQASQKPSAPLEKSEQVALVNQCLAQLKPDYREVIILREYQNLSYREIAAVTRSTLSAVKSRLFKARRKLATLLKPAVERQRARAAGKTQGTG
ncbi:MAG: sigma-70 family RNA polymerase sigma factor [Bacteroidetes bacterium]|nr:sigma-70 family RNA polymerase sigma factor [Bacteroidota bacterium]